MDKNGLLEIIAAHRKDDDLDEVLRKNKDYQEALAQQKEAFLCQMIWALQQSRKKLLIRR